MLSLDKVFTVAETELKAMVRSKTFLISVVLLPVVMLGMSLAQKQLVQHVDNGPRKLAVVDPGGRFYPLLETAAQERNARLDEAEAHGAPKKSRFYLERADAAGKPLDELRVALSDRIRADELFAFVEIPDSLDEEKLRYYSDHPAYDDLSEWLGKTVDDAVRARHYADAHLDPKLVVALSHRVSAEELGLYTRGADGRIHAAEKQDILRVMVVPMVPVFLLFFFIVTTIPQLMHSVLTEKTSRISEVLLGSLSPTELMAGKLLGSVGVSLILGCMYLGGGLTIASRMGYLSSFPPSLIAWFLVFLVLAMLLYGSAAMAIGAACNDVKDAQNLMLPVILPLMLPMMVMGAVLQAPSSPMATALSLFPPSTPLIMLLRVGVHPSAPAWQVALSAALVLLTTALCIWAAGRVFRIGLLAHGKAPGIGQMIRWIFAK